MLDQQETKRSDFIIIKRKMLATLFILATTPNTIICHGAFVPQSIFVRGTSTSTSTKLQQQRTPSSSPSPPSSQPGTPSRRRLLENNMNFISTAEYHLSQHKPYAKLSTVAHHLSENEKDVFHTIRQRHEVKQMLLQEIQKYQTDKVQKQQTIPYKLHRHALPIVNNNQQQQQQPNMQYDNDVVYVWKLIRNIVMKFIHKNYTILVKEIEEEGKNNIYSQQNSKIRLVRSTSTTEKHQKQGQSQLQRKLQPKEQLIITLAQELSKYNPTPQPTLGWKQEQPSSLGLPEQSQQQQQQQQKKLSKLEKEMMRQKNISLPKPASLDGYWKLLFTTSADSTFPVAASTSSPTRVSKIIETKNYAKNEIGRRIVTAMQHIDIQEGTLTNIVDFDPTTSFKQSNLAGFRVIVNGKEATTTRYDDNDDGTTHTSVPTIQQRTNKDKKKMSPHGKKKSPSLELQVNRIILLFHHSPRWLLKTTQTLTIPIPTQALKTMVQLFVTFKMKMKSLLSRRKQEQEQQEQKSNRTSTNNDIRSVTSNSSAIKIMYLDEDLKIHVTNDGNWFIQSRA